MRRGLLYFLLGLAIAVVAILIAMGAPRNLEQYPSKAGSPYRLPFHGSRWVCQGNNGRVSHHDWQEFAYDFAMPQDTPVYAARGGKVVAMRTDRTTFGFDAPANFVEIDHGDGTTGWYLHLRPGGVVVSVGAIVKQGDEIARSGWTGRAMFPHLHFQVERGGVTIPITFADVPGDGIPRAPWFVTGGNP